MAELNPTETVKQNVLAFKRRLFQDAEEPSSKKTPSEILAGGNQNFEAAHSKRIEIFKEYGKPEPTYLQRAKVMELNTTTCNLFFSESGLVHKFGFSMIYHARLGYDPYAQEYKLYVKRDNSNSPPTILGILYKELEDIMAYIRDTVASVKDSVAAGTPMFHNQSSPDVRKLDFWTHDDVFYSQTLRFRLRFVHIRKDLYLIHLNQVRDNSNYEAYYGPRLTFCMADLEGFQEVVKKKMDRVDPSEIQSEFENSF